MTLNINHKTRKKVIDHQAKRLLVYNGTDYKHTEWNFVDFLVCTNLNSPEFKAILNVKNRNINTEERYYLHKYVMHKAWERYWNKYHDRLQQEK